MPHHAITIAALLVASSAMASPLSPDSGEADKRDDLASGDLANARILWVRSDKIYHSTIANFQEEKITPSGAEESNPRWSPDGTKILFVRAPGAVWVMNSDFSDAHEVMWGANTASWTRDGRYITAIAADGYQVYKYELATDSKTVIFDSRDAPYNGEKISQAAELRIGGRFLLTFRLTPGHVTEIVDLQQQQYISNDQMERGDCSPAWAPDGSYIINTARTGSRPVVRATFNASNASIAPSNHFVGIGDICSCSKFYIHGQRISNDGNWVAFGGKIFDGPKANGTREIYVWKIGQAESSAVRLTFDTGEDASPSLFIPTTSGCSDGDSDGYGVGDACAGPDCDDGDASVHPGAAETCNGKDDDCNGAADDLWPDLGDACSTGIGACEETGTVVCRSDRSGAECDAMAGTPAASETCDDGTDDDCDGTVDNGCGCTSGETRDCYGGPENTEGFGVCTGGTVTCDGGVWSECNGQVLPSTELCSDSIDNDCDQATDADDTDCASSEALVLADFNVFSAGEPLPAGETMALTARAWDQHGDAFPAVISWSVTDGGGVTPPTSGSPVVEHNVLFASNGTPGTVTVTVTATGNAGSIDKSFDVEVLAPEGGDGETDTEELSYDELVIHGGCSALGHRPALAFVVFLWLVTRLRRRR